MHARMIRLLAACALIGAAGCVSTTTEEVGGINAVVAVLNPDGTCTLGNRTVSKTALAKALKSAGVKTDSTLLIKIPAGTPAATLAPIDSQLRSAGFVHILYRGPRHADVSSPGQTPALAAPASMR